MRAALLLALGCAATPGLGQEAEWTAWNSPAQGWIGTDPHAVDLLLYEDRDGTVMPVIWEAENAVHETLAGCAFATGPTHGPKACPVELVVDVLLQDGNSVLIVRRLVALGRPGQQVVPD